MAQKHILGQIFSFFGVDEIAWTLGFTFVILLLLMGLKVLLEKWRNVIWEMKGNGRTLFGSVDGVLFG